jgi:hypothetical protein
MFGATATARLLRSAKLIIVRLFGASGLVEWPIFLRDFQEHWPSLAACTVKPSLKCLALVERQFAALRASPLRTSLPPLCRGKIS